MAGVAGSTTVADPAMTATASVIGDDHHRAGLAA
jgi:hypothetical protein